MKPKKRGNLSRYTRTKDPERVVHYSGMQDKALTVHVRQMLGQCFKSEVKIPKQRPIPVPPPEQVLAVTDRDERDRATAHALIVHMIHEAIEHPVPTPQSS